MTRPFILLALVVLTFLGGWRSLQVGHLSDDWVNVSHVLGGEYVGLEEVDNDLWNVHFGPLWLGRFHEKELRIEDALGRRRRRRVLPMYPE